MNAQQARRALDYLVGFNLSPLLWKKAGLPGASAGRVQSPALRMICEREEEILAFVPREYWTIDADAEKAQAGIPGAPRSSIAARRSNSSRSTNEAQAQRCRAAPSTARPAASSASPSIDKKQRKRNPAPPFTTSTLQQEAARKLGFGAQRTMRLAQQLYEGVDFGEGAVGLITYMRTDSLNLANEAIAGDPPGHRQAYTAPIRCRSRRASTRPSRRTPRKRTKRSVRLRRRSRRNGWKARSTHDQFRLYSLIWKRAVASQMEPAVYDTVAVDLVPGTSAKRDGSTAVLRANGSTLVKPGYIAVYKEGQDDAAEDDNDRILPAMEVGDQLALLALRPEQHFTEPPPRFSEASLVKALEEHGIGRPSTYASIISTLVNKKYTELLNRRFTPTDLGKIVNKFLTRNFHHYIEYGFTAKMEDDLDEIADGREEWVPVLERFWKDFKERVDFVDEIGDA